MKNLIFVGSTFLFSDCSKVMRFLFMQSPDAKIGKLPLFLRGLGYSLGMTTINGATILWRSAQKVIDEIKETVPDYDNHTILGGYRKWR